MIEYEKADIDDITLYSLYLDVLRIEDEFEPTLLSKATGFIIKVGDKPYLVTNRHVVTGRHNDTERILDRKYCSYPNYLRIVHHCTVKTAMNAVTWIDAEEPLYSENGKPRWIEHPISCYVDVILLPLSKVPVGAKIFPLELTLADTKMKINPAMPISIVGYPLGRTSYGNFPIWITGHVASDYDLPCTKDLPCFLIDAATRKGLSGSPVYLRAFASYLDENNMASVTGGTKTKFLGVYSGRIDNRGLNIGRVWKTSAIRDIIYSITEK